MRNVKNKKPSNAKRATSKPKVKKLRLSTTTIELLSNKALESFEGGFPPGSLCACGNSNIFCTTSAC